MASEQPEDQATASATAPAPAAAPEVAPVAASSEVAPEVAPEAAPTEQQETTATAENPTGILPAEHWVQAAQEAVNDDDADSALGDDAASSTASITSTILQYRKIHGRTFHGEVGDAQYWGSNDEQQNEAWDMNHHLLTLSMGDKLYLAPLDKSKATLDVGTGTGIWAIDFADENPDCEVIGTDISPIQPSWVPPNLKLSVAQFRGPTMTMLTPYSEIDDCTREWTFEPETFDYVHIRFLVGSIADWPALFKEAYRALKPGGYLESFEVSPAILSDDGTVPETSALGQWGKFFEEGGRKMGRSFRVLDEELQRTAMEEAGFEDITEWNNKAPIGNWPKDPIKKEIGEWAQLTLLSDIEGYVLFMANVMSTWTREEIQVYAAQLRREIRSGKFHGYYRQRAYWGRKPLTSGA
ncbi:putative methyltransferase domain-containing protein [Colletotrichum sublineola]|uniref:Putative methyltransferase domain-containing protein n=1 Tax=Colletotrichum sublineola TaxID=1173701 RepID=A0A066X772_COLSU|nr:putative methyltransferase domain-containing protein [Colletotrichum sublineola]